MQDEEREGADLLTFGEAAEYAGVPLLDLRADLRGMSAPAQWGWRGGVAVQLVPLGVLEILYPILKQRRRKLGPSLAERGIHLVAPDSPAGAQVGRVPQKGKNRPQAALGKKTSPKNLSPSGPGSQKNMAGQAMDPDLANLYQEMEAAAVRNEALLKELSQAGEGLDQLLETAGTQRIPQRTAQNQGKPKVKPVALHAHDPEGHVSEDTIARTDEWNRLMREQGAIEKRQKHVQWASWSVAGLLVLVLAFKGQDWMGQSDAQGDHAMPGPDPNRVAQMEAGASDAVLQGKDLAQGNAFNPIVDSWESDAHPDLEPSSVPGLISFEEAVAAPNMVSPRDWELAGLQPASAAAGGGGQSLEANYQKPLEAESIGVTPSDRSKSPDLTGPDILPLVTSADPACHYGALTAKAQPLRDVLGPCIGPWNPDLKLVAGGFRFAGHRLCRHHQAFQKEFGGSVERATQVAEYATKEGIVPPLVRLRVEHGASQLLQARLGRWVESGFEAGLSKTHRVRAEKDSGLWNVHSWVRLRVAPSESTAEGNSPSPETELRHFVMKLEVDAEQGRDRLHDFRWTTVE